MFLDISATSSSLGQNAGRNAIYLRGQTARKTSTDMMHQAWPPAADVASEGSFLRADEPTARPLGALLYQRRACQGRCHEPHRNQMMASDKYCHGFDCVSSIGLARRDHIFCRDSGTVPAGDAINKWCVVC